MKKLGLAIVASLFLFASCSSIGPVCATGNKLGSKVGESTATFLFGVLPMGESDAGIQAAARKGGITTISTVDMKTTIGIFTVKYTTIVTGE
ncbi:MAG: hypothetical protein J5687_01015 [Treponema sp.]|nr:hypothetical protein [Treponema sp.]